MKITPAAKIGIVFFAIIIAVAIFAAGHQSPHKASGGNVLHLKVLFSDVKGLRPQDDVLYNGYPLGEVETIKKNDLGNMVVSINIIGKDFLIHENAVFTIDQMSILGGKYLSISEGRSGRLISQETNDDNIYEIILPRGEAFKDTRVFYNDAPVGVITAVELDPHDKHADTVRIKLNNNPGIELTRDHSFVTGTYIDQGRKVEGSEEFSKDIVRSRIDIFDALKDGDIVEGKD